MGLREAAEEYRRAALEHDEPWRQRDHESPRAYGHFLVFRDAGPNRNLRDVAAVVGVSYRRAQNLSAQNLWTPRARAWDEHLACVTDEQWRADARAVTELQRKTSLKLAAAFDAWVDEAVADGTLRGLKPSEWIRVWEAAGRAGVARVG